MTRLSLLRLQPDMAQLLRWGRGSGLQHAAGDAGYLLHAATRAALGDLAPKPFALRERQGILELVGYTLASADSLARAAALDAHDPQAAAALRLPEQVVRAMPENWQAGECFSFEARVAPVVRSRAQEPGGYVEVDAAYHPQYAAVSGERCAAYGAWLRAQLARGDAAELVDFETWRFQLTDMVRRTQPVAGVRASRRALLPDLTVRGALRVANPEAFTELLARGLGRHRAFGFGCLLLAPQGAFFRGA